MWAISRWARANPDAAGAMSEIYHALTIALWVSFAWIILGGIPRTIFFPTYEFIPALGKGIVPALVIKHIVMFSGVGLGIAAWISARRAIMVDAGSTQEQA